MAKPTAEEWERAALEMLPYYEQQAAENAAERMATDWERTAREMQTVCEAQEEEIAALKAENEQLRAGVAWVPGAWWGRIKRAAMASQCSEGWYHLPRKWHYANRHGVTLCLRHKIYPMCNPGNPPEGEQCKACQKALAEYSGPRGEG